MKKSDLKYGYLVVINSSHAGTVLAKVEINQSDELVISSRHVYYPLDRLDEDLTYGGDKIVMVYGRSFKNSKAYSFSLNTRGLLWERQEKKMVNRTLTLTLTEEQNEQLDEMLESMGVSE